MLKISIQVLQFLGLSPSPTTSSSSAPVTNVNHDETIEKLAPVTTPTEEITFRGETCKVLEKERRCCKLNYTGATTRGLHVNSISFDKARLS